jgi:hypothetical protein
VAVNRPQEYPFPHLAPDYPIENWELPNGQIFQTVTLQLDNGSYVSALLNLPSIRFTARTRKASQEGVLRRFLDFSKNPSADEDEDDLRVYRERKHEPWLSLKEFLRQHGR